jgi:hypothetical protein
LKAQLKVFAATYRETQSILKKDISHCVEILARDVEKFKEMKDHWGNQMNADVDFELTELANGLVDCVNCGTTALCFCLECKDYLCLNCYDLLHNKGARLEHAPFRLVPCSICVTQPAKLHCTFTDKSLCHKCYAMDHIKMLPPDGKENQPRRIEYMDQYSRYASLAHERLKKELPGIPDSGETDNYESVLSTDWHPFYDVRGVKYYHNFQTGERMRQSPRRVPNTEDPGAEEVDETLMNGFHMLEGTGKVERQMEEQLRRLGAQAALTGFDSLKSHPSAVVGAATFMDPDKGWTQENFGTTKDEKALRFTQPVLKDPSYTNPDATQIRSLRPPHRVHNPHPQVSAETY